MALIKMIVEVFALLVSILLVLGVIWLTFKGSEIIDRKAATRRARRSARILNNNR